MCSSSCLGEPWRSKVITVEHHWCHMWYIPLIFIFFIPKCVFLFHKLFSSDCNICDTFVLNCNARGGMRRCTPIWIAWKNIISLDGHLELVLHLGFYFEKYKIWKRISILYVIPMKICICWIGTHDMQIGKICALSICT
jgi:hypothetical protein